jgi:hypothetical protein
MAMTDSATDLVTVKPHSIFDYASAAINDPDLTDLDRLAASLDALALSFHERDAGSACACAAGEPRGRRV